MLPGGVPVAQAARCPMTQLSEQRQGWLHKAPKLVKVVSTVNVEPGVPYKMLNYKPSVLMMNRCPHRAY